MRKITKLKYSGLSGAKACKSCRSRQELSDSYSNEYLLAKISVDTAENEPFQVHLISKLRDLTFTEPPHPADLQGALRVRSERSGDDVLVVVVAWAVYLRINREGNGVF